MNHQFSEGRSEVADRILATMKARLTPYTEEVFGFEIKVTEGVYPPEKREITILYLEDAGSILLENNPDVLDFGCGSGFLGIYAASKGAHVTAIDINERAVACTIENVKRHKLENRVVALCSDGLSEVSNAMHFDVIMASIPWDAAEVNDVKGLDIAFYDPHFRTRRALFEVGYDYLKPDGCMLLSYSKRAERLNPMASFTNKFHFEIVHTEPSLDGNEEEYLVKATRRQ